MIIKHSTLLLVTVASCCMSLALAASKSDKIKEEKEENKSKEIINNATSFKTKNVNKTIARVEAMLAKNPHLPRLTRGEIIALLDNITRTDELMKAKSSDEDTRRREEKSLLVVLPFIPYNESSKTGLEELYTMEPMTKFVTESTPANGQKYQPKVQPSTSKQQDYVNDMSASSSSESGQVIQSSIMLESPTSTTNKIPTTTHNQLPNKRRRKPSSMKPIVVASQEQRPVYVHKAKTSSTTQPPAESSEVEWRPYTAYDSPAIVTQKPSTINLPTPDKTAADSNIPKNHKPEGHQVFVTMPQSILSSSSSVPAYISRTTTQMPIEIITSRPVTTSKRPRKKPKTTTVRPLMVEPEEPINFSGWKPAVASGFNKPEKKHKITTTTTPMPMSDISVAAENLPADMKQILGSLGLMPKEEEHVMQKFKDTSLERPTIPTSPVDFKPLNPVIDPSSYVSFKRIPDKVQNKNKGGSVMDNDMKQILANFGLISDTGNTYNRRGKALDDDEGPEGRMMKDSEQMGELNEQIEGHDNIRMKPPVNFTLEDINTDVLSDEMKDMLEDLGVLNGSNSKRRNGKGHIFNPVTQSALLLEKPEQAERISKVLIDIKKLSEDNKTHQLNPEEIRAQLYNITAAVLASSEGDDDRKLGMDQGVNSVSSEGNVWNSQEMSNGSGSERDSLEEITFGGDQTFDGYEPDEEGLLSIQNNHKFSVNEDIGSSSSSSFFPEQEDGETDVRRKVNSASYLEIFNKNLQNVKSPPDPLSNEELHNVQDTFKNEVKRQQPENETSTSTTTEAVLDTTSEESSTTPEASSSSETSSSTTESTTTSSTESSSSADESSSSDTSSSSSADDSVPAEANEQSTVAPPTTTESSSNIRDLEESFGGDTPTQRPNGLYFLLDWNSFLRVGQDNRTVNLSFSPKVGDPRNFIQVNVP